MKPVLLLDVDGVLNVIDSTCAERKVTLSHHGKEGLPFYPVALAQELLRLAWDRYDVRWLTAWGPEANRIAATYGLDRRPVVSDDGREDWKARGAARDMADVDVPVAWIEDGITPLAKALVHGRGWFYLHCEPYVGVTPRHIGLLEEFADRYARALRFRRGHAVWSVAGHRVSAGKRLNKARSSRSRSRKSFEHWIRENQGGPYGHRYHCED